MKLKSAVAVALAAVCGATGRLWAEDVRWYQAEFAADLYRAARVGTGNFLLSPYGAASVLGVLASGSAGATAEAFARTLRIQDGEAPAAPEQMGGVVRAVRQMLDAEAAGGGAAMTSDDSIWFGQSFYPRADFVDRTRRLFACDMRSSGRGATAQRALNDYVATRTAGRIPELLREPPPGETALVAVSIAQFRARWAEPFLAGDTAPATFHAPDGDREVPFLHAVREARLCGAHGCRVLRLPYRDSRLELMLLLPNKGKTLEDVEARLGGEFFHRLDAWGWGGRTALALPRFAFERGCSLRPALTKMGLGAAFAEQADFGRISANPLHVSRVEQVAGFALDEDGTAPQPPPTAQEAGEDATQVADQDAVQDTEPTVEPEAPQQRFVLDRPFLFVVRERTSGIILFIGRVVSP